MAEHAIDRLRRHETDVQQGAESEARAEVGGGVVMVSMPMTMIVVMGMRITVVVPRVVVAAMPRVWAVIGVGVRYAHRPRE
jgi:hypothetical protein